MAVIDPKKLLNASPDGGKITSQPKMFLVPVKNTQYKETVELSDQVETEDFDDTETKVIEDIKVIREKVVKIEDILKKTIKINIKKIQLSKKEEENKKRQEKEGSLEKKKEKPKSKLPKIPIPGMSLIDRIKQFLGTIFIGFLVLKLVKFLPKLKGFVDFLKPVATFLNDFITGMLDKFVTAIEIGYKLVDGAQSKVKELFGDEGEKKFKEFTSTFTKFMNLAIIAGMATMGGEDPLRDRRFDKPERRGFDRSGRRVNTRAQERYRQRYGNRQYTDRFGKRNLRRLTGRGFQQNVDPLSRFAQRGVGKVAGRRVGAVAGKIPIVGPLIDFGIRTLIFKEPLGKAAAGAVGAGVGQALGTWLGGMVGGIAGSVVPIIGNLLAGAAGATIGGIIGGLIGDQIGISLYNTIKGSQGNNIESRSQGGQIGRKQRNIQKIKKQPVRIVKYQPEITRVGKNTGQKPIENLYGTSDKTKKPINYLVKTSFDLKKRDKTIFSKLMALGIDLILGQRPSPSTKKNISRSFYSLFENLIDASDTGLENITRMIQALSSGGTVKERDTKETNKRKLMREINRALDTSLSKDFSTLSQSITTLASAPPSIVDGIRDMGERVQSGLGGLREGLEGLFGQNYKGPITQNSFVPLAGAQSIGAGSGQSYGSSRDGGRRKHEGIDLTEYSRKDSESPVVAYKTGKVILVAPRNKYPFGEVMIDHGNGLETRYLHIHPQSGLKRGQIVYGGQQIGRLYRYGNPEQTHLHFEVYVNKRIVNPTKYAKGGQNIPNPLSAEKAKQTHDSKVKPKPKPTATPKVGPASSGYGGNGSIRPAQVIPLPKGLKLDVLKSKASYEESGTTTIAIIEHTKYVPIG